MIASASEGIRLSRDGHLGCRARCAGSLHGMEGAPTRRRTRIARGWRGHARARRPFESMLGLPRMRQSLRMQALRSRSTAPCGTSLSALRPARSGPCFAHGREAATPHNSRCKALYSGAPQCVSALTQAAAAGCHCRGCSPSTG